jgi:hypothetical protein
MAHYSRYLGETGQAGGGDAVRAAADAMMPKWRRARAPRCRVGKRRFECGITFVVLQIEGA